MALTRRQVRFYTYKCSLYKPAVLAAGTGLWAADAQTQYTPAFTNVPCLYKPTPELDVPDMAGRSAEANLFTLDEWHFDAAQPLADTWIIKLTGSDPNQPPHPYIGRFWVIRDNSQMIASQGRRPNNAQMVYALLANVPGLSGRVSGLD